MKGKEKKKQGMRRFMALFLSLMLICAMSITAFATENGGAQQAGGTENTGTKVVESTHTYIAYQIFAGTYDSASGKLSNITWGVNVEGTAMQGVIVKALGLNDDAQLPDILDRLQTATSSPDGAETANNLAKEIVANKGYFVGDGTPVKSETEVKPGYYILIDATGAIDLGDSRGFALLQCLEGKITVTEKRSVVTSDKQVKDVNDSNAGVNGEDGEWGTSADYDIGDEVEFVLKGTVADNYDMYEKYEFVFHDTQSAGLELVDGSFVVKVYDKDEKEKGVISNYKLNVEGNKFDVIFEDLKKVEGVTIAAGDMIEVSYRSKLNEKAVIGSKGNENTMYLEYSNNPNSGGTGKTPETTVIVFTYKVDVNKVDGTPEHNELPGAGFTLYKVDNSSDNEWSGKDTEDKNNYKLVATYESTENSPMTTFSFNGIDDGVYLLVETKTPAGYNSIDPVPFEVKATHDGLSLTYLNGEVISGEVKLDFGNDSSATGTLATNVVNQSGSLLPSTGGIGTTMFYIIGGILMVGACMMLFVRKIMTNEKR